MTRSQLDIQAIAQLACLAVPEDEVDIMTAGFIDTLKLIEKINQVNTEGLEPMSHPLGTASQPLRADIITEENQRDPLQATAPDIVAGLYRVPQFIETE